MAAQWPFRGRRGNKQLTITSSTAEVVLIPAYVEQDKVTPIYADVYALVLGNRSATNTDVTINDASSGTKRFVIPVPAHGTVVFMVPEDAAHQQDTGNNNWTAQCRDQVDSIEITALFRKNT